MAALILLLQLWLNALKRSPTVLLFYALIRASVWDRLWPPKGLLLSKATRRVSRKTKGSRPKGDLGKVSSKKEHSNKVLWKKGVDRRCICLFWNDAGCDKWPMQSDPKFWDSCANVVKKTCNSSRTGLSKFFQVHYVFDNSGLILELHPLL